MKRDHNKKQNILEAHNRLEEQNLIDKGLITEVQLDELKTELTKEFGDDPELINEVVLTIPIILGTIGIGLSIGKGVDAIGFIYKKLVNFFAGKEKIKNKTKAEKWGEKYHEAIIKGLSWALRKAGFGEDNARLGANILFWTLIGVTFGFGSVPQSLGIPVVILKSISTKVKTYEIGILIVAGILWYRIGSKIKEKDFPNLVHSVENCIEDENVGVHKMNDLGNCVVGKLEGH